jgi:hypothetical protein
MFCNLFPMWYCTLIGEYNIRHCYEWEVDKKIDAIGEQCLLILHVNFKFIIIIKLSLLLLKSTQRLTWKSQFILVGYLIVCVWWSWITHVGLTKVVDLSSEIYWGLLQIHMQITTKKWQHANANRKSVPVGLLKQMRGGCWPDWAKV